VTSIGTGRGNLGQNPRMSEAVELWGSSPRTSRAWRDVERLLGVTFRMHESASIGLTTFAELDEPESDLILRPNLRRRFDEDVDDPDDAFAEAHFPDFGVLLLRRAEEQGAGRRASRRARRGRPSSSS